jgi:hypothetical protein
VPIASPISHRVTSASTLAGAAVIALAAVLSGCDKPAPGATVFSGTRSANRQAICWSPDADQTVSQDDCSITLESTDGFNQQLIDKVPIIPTAPGDTVGISVDAVVAESGWRVSINGRPLSREPITDKYFKFTMPPQPLRRGDAQLVIQAMTSSGDGVRGNWIFGLSSAQS